MIDIRDMFQWDRYITPLIAPIFFWVATLVALMAGFFGLTSGVLLITNYPLVAILLVIASILIACLGILAARLFAEFVLVSFRTNDHIYAIRVLAQPAAQPETYREEGPKPIPHAA
jgi:Domain of unknown function (DUF4282)